MGERILHRTKSICPVCLARVDAQYVGRGDEVFFVKDCETHGHFETLFWHGAEHFLAWSRPNPPQPPKRPAMRPARGCPYDCGLCGNHKQATCCVLLELTARCDLGCPTCFASAGREAADPPLSAVEGWYDMLMARGGPFNIQLSGGEPTMRDDLPAIIRMGREKDFRFFQLNTNGLRIAKEPGYLRALASAGLNTVFLQFDTLDAHACVQLRGRDIIAQKKAAIKNCAEARLGVVLVPTVLRGCNDGELGELLRFAARRMPTVRGVHFQPMSYFGRYKSAPGPASRMTIPDILAAIEAQTHGKLPASDFMPGGAEHPLCSFHADYEVDGESWTLSSTQETGCCCAGEDAASLEACDTACEGASCHGAPVNTSDIARDAVAGKWSAGAPAEPASLGAGFDVSALDRFLERKALKTLAISGMAFQDAWTADVERLSRCYINIVSPEGTLMPFCSYNLTAADGTALHRR